MDKKLKLKLQFSVEGVACFCGFFGDHEGII